MVDLPAQRDPDLTAALAKLSGDAITALGWEGTPIGPVTVLGRRVVLAVELLPDVHAQREATGWEPVIDRAEVTMWAWSELSRNTPRPAVRLQGVLAPATHWRTALFGCAPFVRMCPTAVLLPWDTAKMCVPDASLLRVGVVGTQGGNIDVRRDPTWRAPDRVCLDGVQRWVLEVAYHETLTRLGARC